MERSCKLDCSCECYNVLIVDAKVEFIDVVHVFLAYMVINIVAI